MSKSATNSRWLAARAGTVALSVCLALAAAAPGARAQAVPEVKTLLDQHAAAHGGRQALERLKSLRIEGIWEAFSTESPMIIYRQRPALYRIEQNVLGSDAVLGHDGKTPWVKGAAFGAPQGQEIGEDWRRNVLEDAVFGCPLLAAAAAGEEMTVTGATDVEGTPAWVIKVTPAGGNEATWFLDAESGLEIKRENRTFDVFSGGIEIPMETWYMDFREVAGVRMPFREERHFGTRYHVYRIEKVEANPSLALDIFQIPAGAAEPAGR